MKFELTEKGSDCLGFKALRDLLGSLGKSSFGRHDTRDLATGIESSGPSRPYEFGDTMNLDVSGTLLSAVAREGLSVPLNVEYKDLLVHQAVLQVEQMTGRVPGPLGAMRRAGEKALADR
jgi:Ca-activated chloride channel family protein